MATGGQAAEVATTNLLDTIKRVGIIAMFSDDELMDRLVLKGGNAMAIVHQVNSRASVDLDFSVEDDLDLEDLGGRVANALRQRFEDHGYAAFDIKITQKPGKMPDDLAAFWGGYQVEFKLIAAGREKALAGDIERMRREAVMLGEGSKFTMDISRHEYVAGKAQAEVDGYTIYVYTPLMIACEKLRAICQQMPEYADIIKRKGLGNQRARDFVDIEALAQKFSIDVGTAQAQAMLRQMFDLKHVPLSLLPRISGTREFHRLGFNEVRAAMAVGAEVQSFDYYFDFVVSLVAPLEALGNV